jgi:hypothetical protein
MELILSTPALTTGLHRMFDRQRDELAAVLAAGDTSGTSGFTAQVVAAQAIGVVLAVKSRIYECLVAGGPAGAASACLADEIDTAFGLLEDGIGNSYRKEGDVMLHVGGVHYSAADERVFRLIRLRAKMRSASGRRLL